MHIYSAVGPFSKSTRRAARCGRPKNYSAETIKDSFDFVSENYDEISYTMV